MKTISALRSWAARLKRDVITLMFAIRDPETPPLAKLLALATVAYALSPIDLIPDFIPVLGYLDDVIIVPLAVWLCLRLIAQPVIARNRAKAEAWLATKPAKPRSWVGLALIVALWLLAAWLVWRWLAGAAA